jgi:hypothetical protein
VVTLATLHCIIQRSAASPHEIEFPHDWMHQLQAAQR